MPLPAASVVIAGAIRVALAQTASVSIAWDAPSECPDQAYVRAMVERLLGTGPRPEVRVEAHAEVKRSVDGQWSLHLSTTRDGTTGERAVDAPSCRSLADAAALIVALTVDPARVDATMPTGPSPDATASATPPTPSTSTPIPTSTPTQTSTPTSTPTAAPPAVHPRTTPSPARSRGAIFAALGGDLGTLPEPAYGVIVGGSVFLGALRLEGYGAYLPPQTRLVPGRSADGGTMSLFAGGARGCFTLASGDFDVAPCAGLELGDLHGVGFLGMAPKSTVDGWWVAMSAGARATVRLLGPLRLGVDLEAVFPLRRDTFVFGVNGQNQLVHQAYIVESRAFLAPELRF